jgi:hypothetical protein
MYDVTQNKKVLEIKARMELLQKLCASASLIEQGIPTDNSYSNSHRERMNTYRENFKTFSTLCKKWREQ